MQMSIRSRLLLLVLSVLLPGSVGVGWLIGSTIEAERDNSTRLLDAAASALVMTVDDEMSRRATLARVLALAHGLDAAQGPNADDLNDLDAQVHAALPPGAGWVELWGPEGVVYDSRQPIDSVTERSRARKPSEPLSDRPVLRSMGGSAATPAAEPSAADARAVLIEPVQLEGRTVLNVAVMLPASELQRLVDSLPMASGWAAAVADARGEVLAWHRGAGAASGAAAVATAGASPRPDPSGPSAALALSNEQASFDAVTAGSTASTGRVHRSRFGWSAVVAVPRAALAGDWPAAASQMAMGALALLLLAAIGSFWLAQRIAKPLREVTASARRLHHGLPVQPAHTGVLECDEVTQALVSAGVAIRHSRDELQQQVSAAVSRTRLSEQVRGHGQRVQALGRLTGGVAHDFNNLLGVISNSLHLVQRHPAAADLQVALRASQQAVDSGSQLTRHLLRLAGRRPTQPRRLALQHWLPEVQGLIAGVLGSRISVQVEVAVGTPSVKVDPAELELALLNLSLNASDAMASGGELRLLARRANAADTAGRPGAPAEGGVLIAVADDGAGIDGDLLRSAFEPLTTTKTLGKGSGLGLGMGQVLGFCKQAGGTAWGDSTVGIGTTVSLLLPAAPPIADSARITAVPCHPATDPVRDAPALAGAWVLLVEDNPALADTTEALLRAHGAEVQRAADAAGALRLVDREPGFDVVLSDVMMPGGIDGLGLARRLQQQRPDLPVLLISGHNETAAKVPQEFMLLQKPCPPEELLRALRRAIKTPTQQASPAP